MSDTDTQRGTVERFEDKSSAAWALFSKRDVAAVVVVVLLLHWVGLIQIPLVSGVDVPYGHVLRVIVASILITYALVWGRFKRFLEEIVNKDWEYIALTDATGDVFGSWKTHPETLARFEDYVDFESGEERVTSKRDGVDAVGRDWHLVRDLRPATEEDDTDADWVLENIQGWDDVPEDDQIIADKTKLKYWVEEVLPEAEMGRMQRLSEDARTKSLISKVTRQLAVMHEHATDAGVVNVDEMFSELIDGYEETNLDVDSFLRETNVDSGGYGPNRMAGERDERSGETDSRNEGDES